MDKTQVVLFGLAAVLIMLVGTGDCLQCYQCNSYTDKTCADPLNITAVKPTECEAGFTYCRKIDQTTAGHSRTVRQCGKTERDHGCMNKVGSKNIRATYCSCTDEACNSAPGRAPLGLGMMLQALASLVLAYFVTAVVRC